MAEKLKSVRLNCAIKTNYYFRNFGPKQPQIRNNEIALFFFIADESYCTLIEKKMLSTH